MSTKANLSAQAVAIGAICGLITFLLATAIVNYDITMANADTPNAGAEPAETPEEVEKAYLPGQSLDAVRLEAPAFATGSYCYKITDRTSQTSWYLIQMPDGDGHWRWQVLPVEREMINE